MFFKKKKVAEVKPLEKKRILLPSFVSPWHTRIVKEMAGISKKAQRYKERRSHKVFFAAHAPKDKLRGDNCEKTVIFPDRKPDA